MLLINVRRGEAREEEQKIKGRGRKREIRKDQGMRIRRRDKGEIGNGRKGGEEGGKENGSKGEIGKGKEDEGEKENGKK